jgi:PIN domain nuclease of toxin-antitoxin system
MSAAGVADTHTTLWYLFGDPRLSAQAKQFIDQAAADRRSIEVSPISLAEIVYLVEKESCPIQDEPEGESDSNTR